ncbi:hypothetical protein FA15DRAFT_633377 [Coprinopsis marcescibilis]|uniref:Uncharacterized protein n=1 Tax=Coprinopsis marcescibilis TaxID=230819 RepID=A0A5C3L842_COPMA|nr:hypothetical protein FA15DRAFT_633377 [Coprinopsis marcescibilis]
MSTSELTDALNPYAVQRIRPAVTEYTSTTTTQQHAYRPLAQPPAQYVPHRSELELAIIEPQPVQTPAPRPEPLSPRSSQPSSEVQILQELLRVFCATKDAQDAEARRRQLWEQEQEAEAQRRRIWEQEQEAKAARRQAEVDEQMLRMREELSYLRSFLETRQSASSSTLFIPHRSSPSSTAETLGDNSVQLVSPISPMAQTPPFTRLSALQGNHLLDYPEQCANVDRDLSPTPTSRPPSQGSEFHLPAPHAIMHFDQQSCDPPSKSTTPEFSSQSQCDSIESSHPTPAPLPPRLKQKRQNISSSSENDSDCSYDSSVISTGRPRKRANHHDKRCLTIQHAMRAHFWHMLGVSSDSRLPESHVEGQPLGPSESVSFVWDKTTKQSVHNARMKGRILADLKQNRQQYKYVPVKDFNKKVLDAAFEQCFTTFRQKYRAQTDEAVAAQNKKREEIKARKARHASRRKMKLANRAEARMNIRAFEHVVFDSALRIECMSSEESEVDSEQGTTILRTRGYAWRSSRLLRFFHSLDQEDERSNRPRRGSGRRQRHAGPPKEDSLLPPRDVATWMISRRWFKSTLRIYPDLPQTLGNLTAEETVAFDWGSFHLLGDGSEASDEEIVVDTPSSTNPANDPSRQLVFHV